MRRRLQQLLPHGRVAIWLVVVVVWAGTVVAGAVGLYRDAGVTSPSGLACTQWPQASRLSRRDSGATLLFIAHPHCPCTHAGLEALARLLCRRPEVDAHVLLVRPQGAPEGWEDGPIAHAARALPGVQVHIDADGAEARAFGVATSGHVLVYDAGGRLVFSGGLTPARGHGGACVGLDAAAAALDGASTATTSQVFGCSLQGSNLRAQEARQ
jgi:hypothetical protein